MQEMSNIGCRHLWDWRSRVHLRDPHLKMPPELLFSVFQMLCSSNAPIGLVSSSQYPYSAWPRVPSAGPVLACANPRCRAWYPVLLQCPPLPCSWLDGWIQFESLQLQHPGSHLALQSQNLPQILLSNLSFISCYVNFEHSQHPLDASSNSNVWFGSGFN